MTENVQHHLLTATLLNLQLTKELHQKMEEKDQQIVELQKQVKEQGNTMDAKIQKVDTKLQDLEQQAINLDTKVSDLKVTMEANTVKIQNDFLLLNGFSCHEFTLTEFMKQQVQVVYGYWNGGVFTAQGWKFTFIVYTKGLSAAAGTNLTVCINKEHDAAKTEGVAILQMLNQLGDHGHYIETETNISKQKTTCFGDSLFKFFPLDHLGYCADTNTQYLKDDCLKFRLFMKVKAL